MLPIDTTRRIEDDLSVRSDDGPLEYEDAAFQIFGMDVLERALQSVEDYPIFDFDDDSSCDDQSFSNDSLDFGSCRRRRVNGRGSNDSYANDSVDIARMKMMSKRNDEEKDMVPIGSIEIVDLTPDGSPIILRPDTFDIKTLATPVATPDVSKLRPKSISNSAA